MGVRVATYLSDRLCTVVVRSDTMGTSYVVQCFLAFACEVDAFPCLCSARVSGGLLPFFTFSFFLARLRLGPGLADCCRGVEVDGIALFLGETSIACWHGR